MKQQLFLFFLFFITFSIQSQTTKKVLFIGNSYTAANNLPLMVKNTSSYFETIFWDFGDGNTSSEMDPIHNYTESGFYTISQTVNKCGKSDTKTKTIDIIVLGTDLFNQEIIKVYPNPTSEILNLEFNRNYESINVTISDLSGKSVLATSTKIRSELALNISNLSKGIYVLKLIADESIYFEKVIKK